LSVKAKWEGGVVKNLTAESLGEGEKTNQGFLRRAAGCQYEKGSKKKNPGNANFLERGGKGARRGV